MHDVAAILYLTGKEPVRIETWGQRILQPGIEDDTHLHMQFADGAEAHIHNSWLWPELRRRLTVIGTEAMTVYDESDHTVQLYRRRVNADLSVQDDGMRGDLPRRRGAAPARDGALPDVRQGSDDPAVERRKRDTRGPGAGAGRRADGRVAGGGSVSDPFVHPTAVVDEGATIGEGTKIWHFSHVMSGAMIGRDCSLGQNVFVASGVIDRRRVQDPEQRLGLRGRDAGGPGLLWAEHGLHERPEPEGRVPDHDGSL